jgi:hypothetical protein
VFSLFSFHFPSSNPLVKSPEESWFAGEGALISHGTEPEPPLELLHSPPSHSEDLKDGYNKKELKIAAASIQALSHASSAIVTYPPISIRFSDI